MEPVNVVTLVGLLGTAIGYLFTRLDQRNIRARLKNDIELLGMVPTESAAHASLVALVDREAEHLNRRWVGLGYRLLPRGGQALGAGVIVYLAAYVAHYAAFHYFSNSMTVYVTWDGGGGYVPTSAANWIVGTTSSLQTLAIAVGLLGAVAIGGSFIFRFLRKPHKEPIDGLAALSTTGTATQPEAVLSPADVETNITLSATQVPSSTSSALELPESESTQQLPRLIAHCAAAAEDACELGRSSGILDRVLSQ